MAKYVLQIKGFGFRAYFYNFVGLIEDKDMRKSFFLLILVCFSHVCFGQIVMHDNNDVAYGTVNYNLERNLPLEIPKLTLELCPIDPYTNFSLNFTLAASMGAEYAITRHWSVCGNASYAYLSGSITLGQANPPQPLSPYHQFNGGVIFYFLNETEDGEAKVILRSESFPNSNANYFIDVPMKKGHKFGVEAGLNNVNIISGGNSISLFGYDVNDPTQTNVALNNPSNVNFTSFSGYAGLNFAFLTDYKIFFQEPRLPSRDISNKMQLYFDVLLPFYGNYSNATVLDLATNKTTEYEVNKYTPKNSLGYRLGYKYVSQRKVGMSMGLEAGFVPGLSAGSPLFFDLRLGLALCAGFPSAK